MALTDYQVLTPERVSLQYEVAGIGSRAAAALVDALIQGVLLLALYIGVAATVLGSSLAAAGRGMTTAAAVVAAFFLLAAFIVTVGYFILFEIVWNGQTPGKRLVGLRVIRENGYPLRPADAVIRNLVRVVDALPGVYLVGLLVMLLNARSRRLGDFAAGSIVVHEGAPRATPFVTRPPQPAPQLGPPVHLSSQDATLVRDFLLRRSSMEPRARAALAKRLASVIGQRYGLLTDSDPEGFLERLA